MSKGLFSLLTILMMGMAPFAAFGAVAQAAASSNTLYPAADTYIDSTYPGTNFGTRTTLRVDGSPLVRSYLCFDLGPVSGVITQARLRIYANSASSSGISVFPVSSTSWVETGVTYNAAPGVGAQIAVSSAVAAGTWKEIDITGLVQGKTLVSLALGTPGGTAISLASRESGANAPQLLISTAVPSTAVLPPATATPGPTSTLTPIPTSIPPTVTPVPSPVIDQNTILPVADAYVEPAYPATNFGARATLRVDGSPLVRSYLRFDLSQAGGTVTRALLRVYANTASTSGISVYPVAIDTWGETTLTYNAAPSPGGLFATSSAVGAGTWKELDVTGLVQGKNLVSLALGTPGATAISIASREAGASAPRLVVTVSTSVPAEVVLLAAGDIAKCGGGAPSPTSGAKITSDMLLNAPGSLFTLGDNSNDDGSPTDYANCFDPTWGRLKDRIHPVMGNHDQNYDPQGVPYFNYFGEASHPASFGHYSLDLGSWHIVVLNAQCGVGEQGCGAGSIQEKWLRADLAANSQKCTLALWHQPLFSSGTQSPHTGMRAFWQALWDYHADIVLNGHDHNYERFAPQDPFGNADGINGIREFVVGTGGASLDKSSLPMAPNQEIRSAEAYGYLKLTLKPDLYDWQFVAQPGSAFTDSGTTTCH